MRLIANGINGKFFRDCLPFDDADVDSVLAAIAYADDTAGEQLLENCFKLGVRLDLWVRYDHTVPVQVPFLERLLRSNSHNVFCKFIPDCLHSKIIWWKGHGAYVGSANLTDRAWNSNIETGVFFDEGDLISSGMIQELEVFFDGIKGIKESWALSQEDIDKMQEFSDLRRGTLDLGKDKRTIPVWGGISSFSKKSRMGNAKETFRKEWFSTLGYLEGIAETIESYTPDWIKADVPLAWQVDQFLHAYYYNVVGGRTKAVEESYLLNKKNPSLAVKQALEWWVKLSSPPTSENISLEINAPFIKQHCSKDAVLELNESELSLIFEYTHATKDHVNKIKLADLGVFDKNSLNQKERLKLFGKFMLEQKNAKGQSILELFHYVLYGGPDNKLWERMFEASKDDEFRFNHYGLNSIAELVGWVRPDVTFPRNGRTNKALKALGYDVEY